MNDKLDCKKVNLNKGSEGNDVKVVQRYLQWLGLYKDIVDGFYGNKTVDAVKKLQKQYNLVSDGNFGEITCRNAGINGEDMSKSALVVDNADFKDMIKRYENFKINNGRSPNIMYLSNSNHYRYISLQKYLDMKNRWDSFIKTNGREPKFVNINKASISQGNTLKTEDELFIELFSNAVGKKITSFRQGYEAIKYRGYILYYNDIYSAAIALNRLKNKSGLNCCDISQLLYRLAKAFKLDVHYVHLKCKSGTGHIIIKVKEKGSSKWTWVDGAAALSSGKAYGQGWCYNGKVLCEDDKFLMSDDGKT